MTHGRLCQILKVLPTICSFGLAKRENKLSRAKRKRIRLILILLGSMSGGRIWGPRRRVTWKSMLKRYATRRKYGKSISTIRKKQLKKRAQMKLNLLIPQYLRKSLLIKTSRDVSNFVLPLQLPSKSKSRLPLQFPSHNSSRLSALLTLQKWQKSFVFSCGNLSNVSKSSYRTVVTTTWKRKNWRNINHWCWCNSMSEETSNSDFLIPVITLIIIISTNTWW